jgi:uncharacterized membrane protein YdjX (TVP38/TMEM64 family)
VPPDTYQNLLKGKLMNVILKRFLPVTIFGAIIVTIYLTGLIDLISLDTIKDQRLYLLDLVSKSPVLSVIAFMGLYISTVALSLPIASLLTLLGGFLFGVPLAATVIVTSATIGASIIFLLARTAIGETLRDKAGPFYKKVESNMKQNAFQYMLFIRLVPVLPFFVANILPALFNVKFRDFVITTFIGIIPGTVVYTNIGRELGTITSLSDLISPQTLGAFMLLGLFALLPTFIKLAKRLMNSRQKAN